MRHSTAVESFRKWLWQRIQDRHVSVIQALHCWGTPGQLPNTWQLLHGKFRWQKPYLELLDKAAKYVRGQNLWAQLVQGEVRETDQATPADPGDWKLAFGKYAGEALRDIADADLGYLDWLGSQTWLTAGTKKALHRFLEQPWVRDELDRRFGDDDHRCGGSLHPAGPAFNPSEQTVKHFNLGKPKRLRIEWDRVPFDELNGHPELSCDPEHPRITKKSEAWDLAADLAHEIDNAECIEDVSLPEIDERIDQLGKWLDADTMKKLRDKWKAKRDRFSLVSLLPEWKREAAEQLLALDDDRQLEYAHVLWKNGFREVLDAADLLRMSGY